MKTIYVCPVSGGAFPIQIALISQLSDANIKPDILLGSSGGNIAGYLSMAGEWQTDKIKKILTKINSSLFAASWWPNYMTFLPSILIGYFKGSLYADGVGSDQLFKNLFAQDNLIIKPKVTSIEIWTGTMNKDTGRGQIFCNKSLSEAIIKDDLSSLASSYYSRQSTLTYLDGDVDKIAAVSMASAAIPMLVPDKIINGERFVDGGLKFSSPLTALREQLYELIKKDKVSLIYINSYDHQTVTPASASSFYDCGSQTIGELVKAMCDNDRLAAVEMLKQIQLSTRQNLNYVCLELHNLTEDQPSIDNLFNNALPTLSEIKQIQNKVCFSLLELSPLLNGGLNLLNFDYSQIDGLMNQTVQGYKARFWWVGEVDHNLKDVEITKITDLSPVSCPVLSH